MRLMHLQVKRAGNGRIKVLTDKQATRKANATNLAVRQKERRSVLVIYNVNYKKLAKADRFSN